MPDRDTVSEVIVAATLRVEVPVDRGGELAAGAQEVLESLTVVRYADVREIVEVDAGDDGLAVTIDCRLTLHVDEPITDGSAVQEALLAMDRVLGIDRSQLPTAHTASNGGERAVAALPLGRDECERTRVERV